ncbi:MAG: hypothetical protein CVV11_14430 [Gammaproteobacteria bacterium HGW-Gammaproteobacteria-15]|nr:MAG: hypothetical protein CVV11_14430 [Gammaproteobacteria bacterium HGW-Gammaproteobacteria-15]
MKKAVLIISLAVLAGLWFFWPGPVVVAEPETAAQPAKAKAKIIPASVKPAAPQQVTVTETISAPVSESFKILASAYAAELELPPYSRPLSADDEHLLAPNRYIPQTVPLEGSASATIVLPKFRFSYPEAIPVTLQVSGIQVSDVNVALSAEGTTTVVATEEMRGTPANWSATFNAEADWNGAFEISVSFSANGQQQVLKTGIEYSHPVATITGVGDSRGAGSDMLIPVKIAVQQGGYYRLRANLFTEKRQPLALLTGNAKLSEGQGEITLRAFKAVLQQQSGPYILGTFMLEKRPAVPGELTQYGDSEKAEYQLDYFALSQLTDEPWQPDAEELQRLQFLQQMAGQQ